MSIVVGAAWGCVGKGLKEGPRFVIQVIIISSLGCMDASALVPPGEEFSATTIVIVGTPTTASSLYHDTTTTTGSNDSKMDAASPTPCRQHPLATTTEQFQLTMTTGDHDDGRLPSTMTTGSLTTTTGQHGTESTDNGRQHQQQGDPDDDDGNNNDNMAQQRVTLMTVQMTTWMGSPATSY
ncbi:hypothetical protein EDB89DRAFT_1909781 [Lactarius sanguifluus]|nr:hypothetical protein EDB89DRAFT_1909781 [Lactarius sanguifluus]